MKTKVFNLIILDESGSMFCIEKQAIDSVNETIQTIRSAEKKNKDQEHFVSLVTFNNETKTVCDCVAVGDVAELTSESYCPNCCTALYDAMGQSLSVLRTKVADGDRVIVTIVTDGEENASCEYSGLAIRALVDELKSKGWVFAYIGANHNVEAFASRISITNAIRFESTAKGTKAMSDRWNVSKDRFYTRLSSKDFDASEENRNFFAE